MILFLELRNVNSILITEDVKVRLEELIKKVFISLCLRLIFSLVCDV